MSKVAFGMVCTWWDDSTKARKLVLGQPPVCPDCGSPLRVIGRGRWDERVAQMPPADRHFLTWGQGKCFPHFLVAKVAYKVYRRMTHNDMGA